MIRKRMSVGAVSLVFIVATFATTILAPLSLPTASAAIENPENRMKTYTEKWLRYRALSYCFHAGQSLDDTYTYDEIMDADFMGGQTTAIGYLNEDGKVSCDDGAFVNNSAKKLAGTIQPI